VAAAARPELLPFACVLGVGGAVLATADPKKRAKRVTSALALCLLPALAIAFVRLAWFGSPAPLALSAKPPDLLPGLRYALAASLASGPLLVLAAPLALRRSAPTVFRTVLAVLAHVFAMALAGGDWMPLYRLAVPILPAALLAGAELARCASKPWHRARVALALAASAVVGVFVAWPARSVLEVRLELIDKLGQALRGNLVTATLDAGLVGAATEKSVLDLAGVTDPSIANLAGGHTSKRVSEGLVENRDVDGAVLLLRPGTRAKIPWQASAFARPVEARLASFSTMERFELVAELALGRT